MSGNDALLTAAFPVLYRNAHNIASRYPRHLRDEIVSELLVTMTLAARGFNGYGDFVTHVTYRMHYHAIDWIRVGRSRKTGEPLVDETPLFDVHAKTIAAPVSTHRQAEVHALLEHVARLPERWQIAVVAEEAVAKEKLGVSSGRIWHLRLKARQRLRDAGAYELLEDAA